MRLGKGIIAQNISIIPFEERVDFNQANMTPDTFVWRLLDAFCTHNGSWEVDDADQFGIDQWARDAYLFPPTDPRYNSNGGGDHHIQICVQGLTGTRLDRAGVAFSSDGALTLQPAGAAAILGETDNHGWANIPIFAPASYPPVPGPWSMTKAPGMADILTGAGLPWNWHVSTFGVWQAIRWGDLHPVDPDPLPGDVLAIVQRIEARLNALAAHLGA